MKIATYEIMGVAIFWGAGEGKIAFLQFAGEIEAS